MRVSRLALAAALLPGSSLTALAQGAPLAPHRAVYDLALETASDRSGITGVAGRMVYEFNGSSCEGYTVTFRFVSQIATSDVSRLTDQQTSTYETGDGKDFNFVTRSYVDSALDQELKGTASLEGDGLAVSLDKPKEAVHELQSTQFPTQHLLELIGKAEAGEHFYQTTLFDASEQADKVMSTTVVIGDETQANADDPELSATEPMADDTYWPVDIAYFDLSTNEELPTYRISFKLHENGVTRDLVMDYGEFSMTGTLVNLAMFDAPDDCSQ